jgi:uncharacterized membrane protein YfcA
VQATVFGVAGVIDVKVVAVAALIGLCSVPGAFLARAVVERLPLRLHRGILDAVVMIGGIAMVTSALRS